MLTHPLLMDLNMYTGAIILKRSLGSESDKIHVMMSIFLTLILKVIQVVAISTCE